jgi:hypothetical protein
LVLHGTTASGADILHDLLDFLALTEEISHAFQKLGPVKGVAAVRVHSDSVGEKTRNHDAGIAKHVQQQQVDSIKTSTLSKRLSHIIPTHP